MGTFETKAILLSCIRLLETNMDDPKLALRIMKEMANADKVVPGELAEVDKLNEQNESGAGNS